MTVRRARPQVEGLDARILPSVAPLPLPPGPAVVVAQPHPLTGHGHGTYFGGLEIPDLGAQYHLSGSADLAGLGHVTVTGDVHGVGFVREGYAGGTLTFTNAKGSVTVELVGTVAQDSFAQPPHHFRYRVVGGTGAYRSVSDHGALYLALTQTPFPPGQSVLPGVAHGTFALTV
jgi:hypothetical protein